MSEFLELLVHGTNTEFEKQNHSKKMLHKKYGRKGIEGEIKRKQTRQREVKVA
jgi:hypothetical protein